MRTFINHNSKFIIALLLAFLALIGCRTRKVASTEQKRVQKEHFITYKDSSQLFAYQAHGLQELVYYRIRDGDTETIRVTNGKVKIKTTNTHSKSLQQADSTLSYNTQIQTKTEAKTHSITYAKHEYKHPQSSPVRHTLWLLLIAVLVYICWKYKPFRWRI